MVMPPLIPDDQERNVSRSAERFEAEDLISLLEPYRPMLKLLSYADLERLSSERCSSVGQFRRERAALYFQYLGNLCRDLRALPLWDAPRDAEAFIELDRASWKMQKMLACLALEGVLFYFGIERRDRSLVERCFETLGTLLTAAA